MLLKRVIPCILIDDNAIFKTVKFKNKQYIGDPINTVRLFNDLEVDEIIVLDVGASKNSRGPNYEIIEEIANECFMPLCYGGGISSLEQAERVFATGVEKVSINTAVQQDVALVEDLSRNFGSQSIVVSVDVVKNLLGALKIYSHTKSATMKSDIIQYVKRMENAGAGEIFFTAVHKEGTMSGYDLNLIEKITSALSIPVIANGGCGTVNDLELALHAGASAVACGSKFVYEGPHKAVLVNYLTPEEYRQINPKLFS